ncbi:MAG: phosphorylase [Reyranellaceae bacterium]
MILAATGLQRERRILEGPGVTAIAGGGDADRLERTLEQQIHRARGLASIGIGGGLAPGLKVGDWAVADTVLARDMRWQTDEAWSARLVDRLGGRRGAMLGSDAIVATAADKARLHAATGALAVDMESHVVARVAARHGLPFVALRVISDPAERGLPPAALVGMAPDGGPALGAVLRSLISRPGQLPALLRLARDAERAFGSLLRGRGRLGPGLGFPDFGELALDVP